MTLLDRNKNYIVIVLPTREQTEKISEEKLEQVTVGNVARVSHLSMPMSLRAGHECVRAMETFPLRPRDPVPHVP